jgi:phosphonate transport system permease protein
MTAKKAFPKSISILLSILLPGLGHISQRRIKGGIYTFVAFATAVGVVAWYGKPAWYLVPGLIWAWNIWDVASYPKKASALLPVILWLVMAYSIGGKVTDFNIGAIFENASRSKIMVQQMFKLDFTQPKSEKVVGYTDIQSPCSLTPPIPDHTENGVRVYVDQPCAANDSIITVHGEGFWPDYPLKLYWQNPIGGTAMQADTQTDATGAFSYDWRVLPIVHSTAQDPTVPQSHRIYAEQDRPIGGIELSNVGGYIVQGIYETIALAFLSTIVGAIIAIPFGFLAARNLMTGNPVTAVLYVIIRTILNIVRSIEALIMAIIFVIIVGLGPFPGMIALTIHTTAALGKLYSEVIEGIDPGPIEAIKATGANWFQIVRYAVIPQIVPQFTALTIYRWDINVRSSTIIGFVGGGGIGFFLWQWIILGDYSAVGTAFVAIAVVVIVLDFFSARIRERLV